MDYELIFADRRSVRLQLRDDGSLLVRAPRWMSRREVDAFVASKERWICEKRAILARGNRDWGGAALSPEELAQLRKAAQADLGARLEKWAARLGVHPTKLTIRTQRARWGSCSSRGAISLNALLLLAPETVRDYVVVHELCHMKEMNHSRHFWAEVARILPNYAESRDWLKNNGHALLQRNPAKKMNIDSDTLPARSQPVFSDEASQLAALLRALTPAERQKIWQCSDKLAAENSARLAAFEQSRAQTPAILAYEGLQYQHMAPQVMSRDALVWLDAHLRILSGFYGVLRPFDAVLPYRLEMQAKLAVDGARDLYAFWGGRLYEALEEDALIVNLASEEYAKAVRPYVQPAVRFVSVRFGELANGRVKQKGTFAKMARGEMVRFMAENQISDLDSLRDFDALGLRYADALSDDSCLTFLIS